MRTLPFPRLPRLPRTLRVVLLLLLLEFLVSLVVVTLGRAQTPPIPIRYRITRTAPGQPTIQHVFLKSAMECDLAVLPLGSLLPSWLRITDPERDTLPNVRDCQWVDSAGSLTAGMVRELTYTFTMAGQANDQDPYGPESEAFTVTLPRIPQIPGAPQNPRYVPPGVPSFAVTGRVLFRGPAFGLDVATNALDGIPNFPFYFGGATLTVGGAYGGVTAGDRFVLQVWRERQP